MDENVNAKSSASVRSKLRADLLAGIKVSPLYGAIHYHTMDLRKRLSELRNDEGMRIDWAWEESPAGHRYKVHFMSPDAIRLFLSQHPG